MLPNSRFVRRRVSWESLDDWKERVTPPRCTLMKIYISSRLVTNRTAITTPKCDLFVMAQTHDPDSSEIPTYTSIETERLHLRTVYVSDAEAIIPMISRPEVMCWTTHKEPITELPAAQKWLSDRAVGKDVFNFVMTLKSSHRASDSDDNEAIGIIGSRYFPEVGYMVRLGKRNKRKNEKDSSAGE